jgi:hypothetical protein
MATDIPALKAKIVEERALVAGMVAMIDLPAEQALVEAAQTQLSSAQQVFDKKSQRYTLIYEKVQRLATLDAQIALFTP